MKLTVNLRA